MSTAPLSISSEPPGVQRDHRMSRQTFLRYGGGAFAVGVVVAGGGLTWRAIDQGVFSTGEGPAFAAWNQAGAVPGNPLSLVRSALLAANNHNTQPWIFGVDENAIDLYADLSRNTGALDPTLREMHISVGAALENLTTAAAPNGYTATVSLFPDASDETHIARIDLEPATVVSSDLFEAIPRRHTNRGAFRTSRTPTSDQLDAFRALNDDPRLTLVWLTSEAERAAFADLTIQATKAINADEQQSKDSFVWFRSDWDQLQASKDGITLDTSGLSPLMRDVAKIIPVSSRSTSDKSWLKMTKHPQLSTAPAFGIIVANQNPTMADFVSAGRLYQRIALHAEVQGLAMQPLNQIPERIDRETTLGGASAYPAALAKLLPASAVATLMPFRIGYAEDAALKSPRRPTESVLLDAS